MWTDLLSLSIGLRCRPHRAITSLSARPYFLAHPLFIRGRPTAVRMYPFHLTYRPLEPDYTCHRSQNGSHPPEDADADNGLYLQLGAPQLGAIRVGLSAVTDNGMQRMKLCRTDRRTDVLISTQWRWKIRSSECRQSRFQLYKCKMESPVSNKEVGEVNVIKNCPSVLEKLMFPAGCTTPTPIHHPTGI